MTRVLCNVRSWRDALLAAIYHFITANNRSFLVLIELVMFVSFSFQNKLVVKYLRGLRSLVFFPKPHFFQRLCSFVRSAYASTVIFPFNAYFTCRSLASRVQMRWLIVTLFRFSLTHSRHIQTVSIHLAPNISNHYALVPFFTRSFFNLRSMYILWTLWNIFDSKIIFIFIQWFISISIFTVKNEIQLGSSLSLAVPSVHLSSISVISVLTFQLKRSFN